jgi:hypothetical protein
MNCYREQSFYAGGSVTSGSGSGSHPLPAVTVHVPAAMPTQEPNSANAHHHRHHHIQHPSLYTSFMASAHFRPPSGLRCQQRESGATAGSGEVASYYRHAAAEDASLSASVSAGGSGGGEAYEQQQNECGGPDQHQHCSGPQREARTSVQGGMYQELPGGRGNVATDKVAIPASYDAALEKIVAAAADVHRAVQDALQLGDASSSSIAFAPDVANGNGNGNGNANNDAAEEGEEVDEYFHYEMKSDEDCADLLADAGERKRRRRRMRRVEHAGGTFSTIGGDDVAGGNDGIGGASSSTTYGDRRRAARRVLRGLAALEETIEMLAMTPAPDSSHLCDIRGCGDDDIEPDDHGLAGDNGSSRIDGKDDQLPRRNGRDEEGNEDIKGQMDTVENGDSSQGGNADNEPNEAVGTATLTIALKEMMVDLLLVPTEVRVSLLDDVRANSDDDEDKGNCGGMGEKSSNVGNNDIMRLLHESDTIASRIVVQYLNKSTDHYRLLASLVPAQPLPPLGSVDRLLGRVFPQFVAASGGKTYPTYRKTTAMILGVINAIGSEYAAQGLSMKIPPIDAFVLCHYLAKRGLVDLTMTDVTPADFDGDDGRDTDTVQEAAALQLRKLIVRILGRLLECLAPANVGTGACAFSSKTLLHCLVLESQRLRVVEGNAATLVSTNDVEDCVDVLSEYCTEVMEYALDSLDGFNAIVKGAMSDDATDNEGFDRQGLCLGLISDAHVEGLRESIRCVQIAAKTFSTLHQLGIHPEASTAKSFVANLSDFWAISCNKLMSVARRPLCDGGVSHHLAEDMQQSIDALGQQLIGIVVLTKPSKDTAGRQRGGGKGSKRVFISKEEKSARFVAIVNALSQSQRGGDSDDLCALLHGFANKSVGPDHITSHYRIMSGPMNGDIHQRSPAHDTKRQRKMISYEDDAPMDQHVPRDYCDKNAIEERENEDSCMGKNIDDSIFSLKKADEKEAADSNLLNACMLSSLLLPEFPSLAPQGDRGGNGANGRPSISSYKTAAALSTGMSIQSGSEAVRSLVCDSTNPWHGLVGRKIVDTVAKRDASGSSLSGAFIDSTVSDARGVLLRHAGACRG